MRLPFKKVKALEATAAAQELLRGFGGGFFAFPRSSFVDGAFVQAQAASYAAIYERQPNVRLVVDHIARIVASRDFRLYTLDESGDHREEDPTHPAAQTVINPNEWTGTDGLIRGFVSDFLIWDNAYLWDMGPGPDGKRVLVRVPPYSMGVRGTNALAPVGYRVLFRDGTWIDLELNEAIHLAGYSGTDTRAGTSPLETLRMDILEETVSQAQSIEFIRGGMVRGGIIQRPLEAPEWSDTARERFEEAWATRLKGVNAGRSPVLEEGMLFADAGVTPREAEAVALRQMALDRVAMVYGLHPSLFNDAGGANLNMARTAREEDVIVPLLKKISEAFTRQLIADVYDERGQYGFGFRPRVDSDPEKLFTASKNATQSSVMTVNEYRKQFLGLPPVDGGDDLIQNPGATAGGAPAGEDAHATSDRGVGDEQVPAAPGKEGELETKASPLVLPVTNKAILARRDGYSADYAALVRRHFTRQRKALESGGAADTERWDTELTTDLLKLGRKTVRDEANVYMAKLGATKSFDMNFVEHYLARGAEVVAGAINSETQRRLVKGLEAKADTPKKPTRREVLADILSTERADAYGLTGGTRLAAFAATEAAKQADDAHGVRQKRWVASGLPDSRHADMNGETVPLYEDFSNGLAYPGDPAGDAGEVANCGCALDIL